MPVKGPGGKEVTGATTANNPLAYFAREPRRGMWSLTTLLEFLLPARGQQGRTEKLLHLPCQQGSLPPRARQAGAAEHRRRMDGVLQQRK